MEEKYAVIWEILSDCVYLSLLKTSVIKISILGLLMERVFLGVLMEKGC